VTLEGRVRPQDISDGNVVLSTRLAEARITYLGEGEVSQRQQRAWWRKLLDWAGM
jgi:flagellar L-ring protein FlgH